MHPDHLGSHRFPSVPGTARFPVPVPRFPPLFIGEPGTVGTGSPETEPDRDTVPEATGTSAEGFGSLPLKKRQRMPVWYMAHPVGPYDQYTTAANLKRAEVWLRWLHEAWPQIAVVCPWLLDLRVLPLRDDVPHERELGLERCEATARICDAVVLVGGRRSSGMQREAAVAKLVIDWTHLGDWPPGHPLHRAVVL